MSSPSLRYQAMIGVGGIGAGKFFALNGNHTLGREESRSGRFLDQRDYCKLHIISHYVHAILGSGFDTVLVGKIGDDEWGHTLYQEMSQSGLDLRYVAIVPGEQTLFGLCLVYPDGSGGNIMTSDSACAKVDPVFVQQAEPEFERYAGRGIALAAPEVPLTARLHLLKLATRYRFFRAASLTSEEIRSETAAQIIAHTDLLAVNCDEASALIAAVADHYSPAEIAEKASSVLARNNRDILFSMTAGKQGSWFWDGKTMSHLPPLTVSAISTAGAGDAYLAGILVGFSAGLSIPDSLELARLVAAHSITSPHTINPDTRRQTLRSFAKQVHPHLPDRVVSFLQED